MPKYHVGDKVKILPRAPGSRAEDYHLYYSGLMEKYAGQIFTISKVENTRAQSERRFYEEPFGYYMKEITERDWIWSSPMLKLVESSEQVRQISIF